MPVIDNTARHRYELAVDGQVAFIAYRDTASGTRVLIHTEVPPELNGQGIGSQLVRGALDQIRAESRRIQPSCSFVRAYLSRHPEYADLVAAAPGG
jgi:predicted GNAT family acetyltransferase